MESEVLTYLHVVTTADNSGKSFFSEHAVYPSFILGGQPDNSVLKNIYSWNSLDLFSVTLQLRDLNDRSFEAFWFSELCLLLCHPLYFSYNHQRIIAIAGNEQAGEVEFSLRLNEELKKQGFNDLLFFKLIDGMPDGNGLSFVLNNRAFVNSDLLQRQLLNADFRDRGFNMFILHQNEVETGQLANRWQMEEKKLWMNEPLLYHMAKQLQAVSSESRRSRILIDNLSDDLSSKNAYLDFILNRYIENEENGTNMNELMKLKKFYHNEYEILPLWYKRVGHIIKVLTGKRTLKSLFKKNVKKYKD
jgi:hypothetical protein